MRLQASIDIAVLAAVFWAIWSLRFLGVENIGIWTMAGGVGAGILLFRLRGMGWADMGLGPLPGGRNWLRSRTLGTMAVIAAVMIVGGGIVTTLLGPLETSSAIEQQPDTLLPFLIDLIVGGWLAAGMGEEIFFRGMLLHRLRALFGDSRPALTLALVVQAAWFGAGHASQGLSGMILTGLIALGLAVYFVTRAQGNLWPLMLGHALIDTIALTIAFVS